MPKKTISLSIRHPLRLGLKLVISISALLSFLALIRLHSQSKLQPSVSPSRISDTLNDNFEGSPKIAFLFLVHENLPLDFLWHSFFKVAWGESSMIEAERLLLEAALDDPANQRFVLLSDSCVPLYNFSYINNYLMSSPKSFVDSFLDVKEFRYNPMMSPVIPKHKWRKGSQWITLVKRHAEVVVDDEIVFPVFKKFCKFSYCFLKNLLGEGIQTDGTLLHSIMPNNSHEQIKKIKDINYVYYESEHQNEWCRANSILAPCFLFARKFSRGAAMRLWTDGMVGPYDATALPDALT
ncbi:hypothetical protein F0562_011148 [Nyssa sinensis]|uniref:Uncharacterized protein n=1 Tax=Nyssa sinensis TaxID=561372 RepID=A0A5J5A0W1_9ASTE|nr:hypothetical protein F0562_011148 [Nyssa sinensis]